jgi:hypothetical protein
MRSKWLDWPGAAQAIENGTGTDPTKPTEPGFVGFVGGHLLDISITPPSRSEDSLPVSDPYAERMTAALDEISGPDYPTGMVLWLDAAWPDLYAELTSGLPDEIHLLWSKRAPLEQFESVLARLVSLHRRCCDLCRSKPSR